MRKWAVARGARASVRRENFIVRVV
jgi:hypothetical protein